MRRKLLFVLCLIIGGVMAYYGGYYVYVANRPKVEIQGTVNLQRSVSFSDNPEDGSEEYYVGKIEQDLLVIYEMPEKRLYDSVEISSLRFYGNEEKELMEGMIFHNLTEVYEFLENSMS